MEKSINRNGKFLNPTVTPGKGAMLDMYVCGYVCMPAMAVLLLQRPQLEGLLLFYFCFDKLNLECIELFTTLTKHTDKMEAFQIPIDDDIFGVEVYAQLQKVDMEYICHMKEVSATCIMLYIRQLYSGIKVSNMDTRFAFVNHCSLSENYKTSEASKPGMLASRLEDVKNDQLLLVPCNIG
ncbi:hypothetical protein RHMOL_Rhmol11G0070100 [Rhododendron molle]|uniref:Uncharacterized protein n=1 Tax=Rhododendron molle TaxID=49168 RepID=A0ACC0LPT0_RHOML|nr:hypothetical protein RHMOL_Rhmol11G0070100 [Rhododendron molle]